MDSLENKLPNISGKFFKALIKIENVFESDSAYQNDYNAEMASAKLKEETERNARKITEEQDIAAYLSQQSIQAIKTKNGVFVQIIKKGTGKPVTKGKKVRVNYSGKTLDGKVFDSNIDPVFNHVQPFEFTVGSGNVILGWDDGICLFNEGGKGTLYIPSNMGYWKQGAGENIKPYENLIFDIEILQASANSKKSYKPLTKKKLIKKKQ
jgi:FKBP-type peptidyl-prolyl cis-trans isomerase